MIDYKKKGDLFLAQLVQEKEQSSKNYYQTIMT